MTQLADAHGAINLSQGFPDYAVPEELTVLVAKYMQRGYNHYAPMPGVQYLREQIAAKVLELYSAKYDPARKITDESDLEFARRLTTDFGVAAIPPSVFYHRRNDYKVLRFCFAKKDETLEKAAEKLCKE